jgi:hypothetical protein
MVLRNDIQKSFDAQKTTLAKKAIGFEREVLKKTNLQL